MFGMGGTEILVILIVALLFLGPDKLPEAAKKISKGIRDIKKQSRVLQRTIEDDEHIGGAIRDLKSALRGEDEPIRPKPIKPPKQLVEAAPTPALPEPGAPEHGGDHGGDQGDAAAADHGALLTVAATAAAVETGSGEPTLRGVAIPTPPGEPASVAAEPSLRAVPPPASEPELTVAEPTIRGVVAPRAPEASEAASDRPKLTMPPVAGELDGAAPTAADDAALAALVKPAPHTIARSSSSSSPGPSPAPAAPAAEPADKSESKHG